MSDEAEREAVTADTVVEACLHEAEAIKNSIPTGALHDKTRHGVSQVIHAIRSLRGRFSLAGAGADGRVAAADAILNDAMLAIERLWAGSGAAWEDAVKPMRDEAMAVVRALKGRYALDPGDEVPVVPATPLGCVHGRGPGIACPLLACTGHFDLLEDAWGIIANVGGRDGKGWEDQHADWQETTKRWRERYYAAISYKPSTPAPATPSVEQGMPSAEAIRWELDHSYDDGKSVVFDDLPADEKAMTIHNALDLDAFAKTAIERLLVKRDAALRAERHDWKSCVAAMEAERDAALAMVEIAKAASDPTAAVLHAHGMGQESGRTDILSRLLDEDLATMVMADGLFRVDPRARRREIVRDTLASIEGYLSAHPVKPK